MIIVTFHIGKIHAVFRMDIHIYVTLVTIKTYLPSQVLHFRNNRDTITIPYTDKTPRAHALKGVLLNSAPPDACEPSGRHLYHSRYVKEHISGLSSQNAVYYTPSAPQKQDGAEIFAPRQTSRIYSTISHRLRTKCH